MGNVSVRACAKINVGLLITGRRTDGYHTLETVFAPVNWFDTLDFTLADGIGMSCSNLDLPVDDTNLCIRAAKALRDHAGVSAGVQIELVKRVPFGAGLGGGSSDAAATLRVLNRLWEIDASSAELHRIAVKLGADVPYFLEMKGLAYAAGIGEELEDLSLALPWHIVTVFPEVQVSTVWAYRHFTPKFDREVPDLKLLLRRSCADRDPGALASFENDFAPVVFASCPVVRQAYGELLASGAVFASLSGSGSAVYGLFDDAATASAAMERLTAYGRVNLTPPGFRMD